MLHETVPLSSQYCKMDSLLFLLLPSSETSHHFEHDISKYSKWDSNKHLTLDVFIPVLEYLNLFWVHDQF